MGYQLGVGMKGRVKFEFSLPAEVKKEGKLYIARCPLVDVYSQGTSKKEALANLIEAIQLFAESCFERGTLDEVLQACGFEFMPDLRNVRKPAKAASKRTHADSIRVPLSLMIARRHAEACPN